MIYPPKLFGHHSLVYQAKLLKPQTPILLGLQISSQCNRCSFLTPGSWPHQKALEMESSQLQIALGNLKQEKT